MMRRVLILCTTLFLVQSTHGLRLRRQLNSENLNPGTFGMVFKMADSEPTKTDIARFDSGPENLKTTTFKDDGDKAGYYEDAQFNEITDTQQIGGMTFNSNIGRFEQGTYSYNLKVSRVIDNLFCIDRLDTTDTSSHEQTTHKFDWCKHLCVVVQEL